MFDPARASAAAADEDILFAIRIRGRTGADDVGDNNNNNEHPSPIPCVVLCSPTDIIECPLPIALCCSFIAEKYKRFISMHPHQHQNNGAQMKPMYFRKLTSRAILMVLDFCKAEILSSGGGMTSNATGAACPMADPNSPFAIFHRQLVSLPLDFLCEVSAAAHYLGVPALVEFGGRAISNLLNNNSLSDITSSLNVEQGLSKSEENAIRRTFLKNHLALAGINYSDLNLERDDGELVDLSEIPLSVASLCPKLREQLNLSEDVKEDVVPTTAAVVVDSSDSAGAGTAAKKGKKKKKKQHRRSITDHEEVSLNQVGCGDAEDCSPSSFAKCDACPYSNKQVDLGSQFVGVIDNFGRDGLNLSCQGNSKIKGFLPLHRLDFALVPQIEVGNELHVEVEGLVGNELFLKLNLSAYDAKCDGVAHLLVENSARLDKCESELRMSETRNQLLLEKLAAVQSENMELSILVKDQARQILEIRQMLCKLRLS